jgi:DNA (cytosine-5)-methyltransferase 1
MWDAVASVPLTEPCLFPAAPASRVCATIPPELPTQPRTLALTAPKLTAIEICAGAGGQALGLARANFEHLALVENDFWCCETLRAVPRWRNAVRQVDLHEWTATRFRGEVDLFAGGVPCPPFSRAGKQLGAEDERDLFPVALRLIRECEPRAVMLENVRGLMGAQFSEYRRVVIEEPLREMGYKPHWKLLQASDFGVPQLRPRLVLVALPQAACERFEWPAAKPTRTPTVGQKLRREMARNGWPGADEWAAGANEIAPTLVGGSKRHGGPDLGPTQAKKQWARLGINGHLLAEDPPPRDWNGEPPKLTVTMTALLQGFPRDWPFAGKKTNAYRQVGNAFPPPVAEAVGGAIAVALEPCEAKTPHSTESIGAPSATRLARARASSQGV